MNLKRTIAVSISTAALLLGGAGLAQANDGAKFHNDSQILSCFNLELINIPILSADNNNIDCSTNVEEKRGADNND